TTLVVFSDFECPACKQLDTSLEVVLRTRPEEVRVVWKDMPNESAHPNATPAAVAAHCADRQGKFWEYHDALFERQTFLDPTLFAPLAAELGLDEGAFARCYDALDTLPVVKKDYEEGLALGITATPTVYIGATPYVGALSADDLLSAIDRARANPSAYPRLPFLPRRRPPLRRVRRASRARDHLLRRERQRDFRRRVRRVRRGLSRRRERSGRRAGHLRLRRRDERGTE